MNSYKSLFCTLVFSFLMLTTLVAQKATLHIEVKHPTMTSINIVTPYQYALPTSRQLASHPLENKQVKLTFDLDNITTIQIIGKSISDWNYLVNLSPGDSIYVLVDSIAGKDSIQVSGIGAENSQWMTDFVNINTQAFRQDALPDNFLRFIAQKATSLETAVADYIATYQPTPAFQEALQHDIHYAKATWFTQFFGNHKFYLLGLANADQLIATWTNEKDKLLKEVNLNEESALSSKFYKALLQDYVLRKKEVLWERGADSTFLADYYGAYPVGEREQAFEDDRDNLLVEQIINKEFTGDVNEYMYATLLRNIAVSKKTNAAKIFDRFRAKFPTSTYIADFEPMITVARDSEDRPLTEKMVLLDSTTQLDTFEDLLQLFAGKTVLIDMWGTWCGPCHAEMEKNTAPLKEHFKDKALSFLYVANYDEGMEDKWKKLISYYNLEGTHVLANKKLTEDIMYKMKMNSYPTYIILKKDGSYELSKAGYPMNRQILIEQIEKEL